MMAIVSLHSVKHPNIDFMFCYLFGAIFAYTYSSAYSCELITVSKCMNIGYTMTTFPNTLGHRTQTEAKQDLRAIWPLVELGCSASFREFLCSYYFPKCDPAVKERYQTLPSRYLCENSRVGCELLMNKFGFPWPSNFECNKFPGGCEPITIPMCAQKLKKTTFPNRFGHKNQHEAGLEVNKFYLFVVGGCSDFFQDFLCLVYFPECNPQVDSERWNQLLCNTVRAGCEPIMNEIGMEWPNELSCEQFTSD